MLRRPLESGLAAAIGHLVPTGSDLVSLLLLAGLAAVLANLVNNLPAVLVLLPLAVLLLLRLNRQYSQEDAELEHEAELAATAPILRRHVVLVLIDRLDRSMRAILRAGTYELLARPDVTVGTVIDEYLDIAHAFFGEKDVKFVNGLLDKVAGDVRG